MPLYCPQDHQASTEPSGVASSFQMRAIWLASVEVRARFGLDLEAAKNFQILSSFPPFSIDSNNLGNLVLARKLTQQAKQIGF